jgi:hypothetical protein
MDFPEIGNPSIHVVEIVETGTCKRDSLVFNHFIKEGEARYNGVLRVDDQAIAPRTDGNLQIVLPEETAEIRELKIFFEVFVRL